MSIAPLLPRRRALLAGAALALLPLPRGAARAQSAVQSPALAEAIRAAIGDAAVPEEGGILLRVPALAENGAQVPLSVLVDSPMTATDHVAEIHVFATRNPTPGVASFRLGAGLARAEVQTRIRLAEDQRILVIARHADGRLRQAWAELRVTTGGCLS